MSLIGVFATINCLRRVSFAVEVAHVHSVEADVCPAEHALVPALYRVCPESVPDHEEQLVGEVGRKHRPELGSSRNSCGGRVHAFDHFLIASCGPTGDGSTRCRRTWACCSRDRSGTPSDWLLRESRSFRHRRRWHRLVFRPGRSSRTASCRIRTGVWFPLQLLHWMSVCTSRCSSFHRPCR